MQKKLEVTTKYGFPRHLYPVVSCKSAIVICSYLVCPLCTKNMHTSTWSLIYSVKTVAAAGKRAVSYTMRNYW